MLKKIKDMEEEEILKKASKGSYGDLDILISRAIQEENYPLVTKLRAFYFK